MKRGLLIAALIGLAWVDMVSGAQARRARSADDQLAGVERRRLDVLGLILEDAQGALDPGERLRLFEEYIEQSEVFLADHPDSIAAWSGRAIAAVELNRASPAWTAGQNLIRLGGEERDDPRIRRALAMLERRGWLGEAAPQLGPGAGSPWVNSLGMKFVPVEGTDVLICVWETRVRDFIAFVEATRYDATGGMLSFDGAESSWFRRGASWRLPGFDQSEEHPVVGVNWYDASAFCAWLTLHERRAGVIGPDQQYRLPYDAEWSVAVGPGAYAWGEQWPPPAGVGNFLGEEALPVHLRVLEGFNDGAPRTALVGRSIPNQFGLYDLAGNVQEWCEDLYRGSGSDGAAVAAPLDELTARNVRTLRGASWSYQNASNLLASRRHRASVDHRIDDVGFRCVIVPVASLPGDRQPVSVAASASSFVKNDDAAKPGWRGPQPIHEVEPVYPPDLKVRNESGEVVLEFDIDEQGRVRNPRVVSATHEAFADSAVVALRDWRFVPAYKGGRPTACRAAQQFRFVAGY